MKRTSETILTKRDQLFMDIALSLSDENLLNENDFMEYKELIESVAAVVSRELDSFSIVRGQPLR